MFFHPKKYLGFITLQKGEKELDFVVHETYLAEKAPKQLGKVQVVPIRGHEMNFHRLKLEENGIKNEHVEEEFDSSDNEFQENENDLEYWSSDSDQGILKIRFLLILIFLGNMKSKSKI